jgi:hypothetical protein
LNYGDLTGQFNMLTDAQQRNAAKKFAADLMKRYQELTK